MKITVFIDESVNNSFKDLEALGVEVPERYFKSSYAYVMFNGGQELTNDIPTRGFLIARGQGFINLNVQDDCFNLAKHHKNRNFKDYEDEKKEVIQNGLNLNDATYACSLVALEKALEILVRKRCFNNDITIYSDNKQLAITYQLDSSLDGLINKYNKDKKIVEMLEKFDDMKIIWISREYNKLANSIASKLTTTFPNLEILDLLSERVKEIEKSLKEGKNSNMYSELSDLKYLGERGLNIMKNLPVYIRENPSQKLLLLVKRNWFNKILDDIKETEELISKQYQK